MRQPANFIILYTRDESEGPHCLTESMYGVGERTSEAERWVILERLAVAEGSEAEGPIEEEAEGVPSDAQTSASPAQPIVDSGTNVVQARRARGRARQGRGQGRC